MDVREAVAQRDGLPQHELEGRLRHDHAHGAGDRVHVIHEKATHESPKAVDDEHERLIGEVIA